jgi:hypothetical protein
MKGEKPVWETVSPCSLAVKYHWSRWNTLYLKAGILYRKWENAMILENLDPYQFSDTQYIFLLLRACL